MAHWLLPVVIVSIPVSTSATEISFFLWLVCAVGGLGWRTIGAELVSPAAWVPVVMILVAALGVTWTIAPWQDILKHFGAIFRFITLPILFAQFRAHPNARPPALAALSVAAFIWLLSMSSLIWPEWVPTATHQPGMPFKNYSVQSVFFSLLALGLVHWGILMGRNGHLRLGLLYGAGAVLLLANVLFVTASRTMLIALLPLGVVVCVQLLGRRGVIFGTLAMLLLGSGIWLTSSYVRDRITSIPREVERALHDGDVTSAGLRLVYWRKAIGFIEQRPLLGHGTGSTPALYRQAAQGMGLNADAPGNPHNQILAFAVPFGIIGIILIIGFFAAHFSLFWGRTPLHFMGQLVVLCFIMTGLFNSHLTTFSESKIYLFAVGILGGLVQAEKQSKRIKNG